MTDETPALPGADGSEVASLERETSRIAAPTGLEGKRVGPVLWTIRAKRNLRRALAEALCRESHGGQGEDGSTARCAGVLEQTMDRLEQILAATFPGRTVVVQDQMLGYRRRKDLFVLLVEVFGPDNAPRVGPYVVKVGPVKDLEQEIRGWECCRPPGLRNDLVLLPLEPGPSLGEPPWMSLVYGDAQQFLGVSYTVTFEEAALEAVRTGFPRIDSVGFVIVELFERIGHLLYSQAFVDDPAGGGYALDMPRLDQALGLWENEPSCQAARKDVNTAAESGVERFLDPIDYLRYVQKYVPRMVQQEEGEPHLQEPVPPAHAALPGLPRPTVVKLIPRMLRGCAHGDMHGRNILVGIVRQRMMWPTVFDYEDMGSCNLIGWDFVKLETELKVRAYLDVFAARSTGEYVTSVQKFEIALAEQTEDCHQNRTWPDVSHAATPEERLRAILMMIRRMASEHLGATNGRPNDWLEEYYFLLACYGASTGWFENHTLRERLGALTSSGVATARLSWPRSVK